MVAPERNTVNAGLYEIVLVADGRRYVGGSVNVHKRWREHLRQLRAGSHHSRKLQRAWKKYGEAAFVFRLICTVEPDAVIREEQKLLDSAKHHFNCSTSACGMASGTKMSERARLRMSRAHCGKTQSEAMKEKLRRQRLGSDNPFFGKRHSRSSREKMASAMRGRKLSEETKEKIASSKAGRPRPDVAARHAAQRAASIPYVGRPHSEEAKKKISLAKRGVKRPDLAERNRTRRQP